MDPLGRSQGVIEAMLDAAAMRHRVIARNVANVDTPGYRAEEVVFTRDLAEALREGGAAGPRGPLYEVVERDAPAKPDGNTVDLDLETSALGKNALAYQALLAMASMQTTRMKLAIIGRGG